MKNYPGLIKKIVPRSVKKNLYVRAMAIKHLDRPIALWYWRSPEVINFGDELSAEIIRVLFKKKVERVEVEDADLFAIGSILEVANKPRSKKAYVWGSGFIEPGVPIENRYLKFKSVRGTLTRERINSRYRKIPLGDPGLLTNLIYQPSDIKNKWIGIIPHFVDENNEALEGVSLLADRYKIISVRDTPAEVARQISECQLVLSSSLHGLIVADSFGIPNVHMPLSDAVHGGDYKFKDYYSAINKDYEFFDKDFLYDDKKIKQAIDGYKPIRNLDRLQKSLIRSFPFK